MQNKTNIQRTLEAFKDQEDGQQIVFNPDDAEKCVDLGLLDPNPGQGRGYTLTEKGRALLRSYVQA